MVVGDNISSAQMIAIHNGLVRYHLPELFSAANDFKASARVSNADRSHRVEAHLILTSGLPDARVMSTRQCCE